MRFDAFRKLYERIYGVRNDIKEFMSIINVQERIDLNKIVNNDF
jgi:hypothetical protein